MNNNYMTRVAEMFGVELGEVFEVKNCDGLFRFNEHYLMHTDKYGVWQMDNDALGGILSGGCEIIKKPWIPKQDEKFYFLGIHGDVWVGFFDSNSGYENVNIRIGNYFKTKEEAESHKEKWLEFLNQEPDLLWRD